MKKTAVVFLFLAGIFSSVLLYIYVIAFFLFVFGEVDYPGDIVFVPKWVFLFCPLVFLKRRKEVQNFLGRLAIFFDFED